MTVLDNLRFLTSEAASQVAALAAFMQSPDSSVAQRIVDRQGYPANLQRRIQEQCLRQPDQGGADTVATRSLQLIAAELDRITGLCRGCVAELGQLQQHRRLRFKRYGGMLASVEAAIGQIDTALSGRDTALAMEIGEVEGVINKGYQKLLALYLDDLGNKSRRSDVIHALFVARCVTQMGVALQQISEAIISANLGQDVDTGRYQALNDAMQQLQSGQGGDPLGVESVAETRSGSAIAGITSGDEERVAIFKDGLKRKLKEERQGVESWHQLYPGVAPQILSYKKRGRSAALLIEHLAGMTFERILLHESRSLLNQALHQLTRTLTSVWKETRTRKPVSAQYMAQLSSRLDDVYALHPAFRQQESAIGSMRLPSFDQLVARVAELEEQLKVPYSVYIHGDFNLDNIIYDPDQNRINFIDLHRSQYMDWVQDVSVFMVSSYRLQVLDAGRRRRAMALNLAFYRFAARRAKKQGDSSFELRLALGLARSFVTSTRFILDPSLARAMYLRSRYLLERVLRADLAHPKRFKIPMEALFVG